MDKEKLIEKIKSRAKDNRMPCAEAMKIAEEEQVPSNLIGEILDEIGIKVTTCRLGCFP